MNNNIGLKDNRRKGNVYMDSCITIKRNEHI